MVITPSQISCNFLRDQQFSPSSTRSSLETNSFLLDSCPGSTLAMTGGPRLRFSDAIPLSFSIDARKIRNLPCAFSPFLQKRTSDLPPFKLTLRLNEMSYRLLLARVRKLTKRAFISIPSLKNFLRGRGGLQSYKIVVRLFFERISTILLQRIQPSFTRLSLTSFH